jgi:hypothetical protein
MDSIQILKNIINDYIAEEENIELDIDFIQKELSEKIKQRARIRNNKAIVYGLLTKFTGDEYDKNLFDDDLE